MKVIQTELRKLEKQKKTNTVAYWDLKVAEAEEQKAIQELTGQTKEKNKAQASLMFAFLQAQQGFAANLLGNLIPGGATGGLVGNVSIGAAATAATTSPSIEKLVRQERAGILPQEHGRGRFGIAGDASKQAQISAGAGLTVTRGQGSTQIELLRKILRTLQNMQRGQSFPEARNERERSGASIDYGHGGGGSAATA